MAALAVLAPLPATAAAAGVYASRHLWATINLCDTAAHPDQIGIRGSMPGSGRRELMFMRFQVQFYRRSDGRWHNIPTGADSGFIRVGSARYKARQAGWTFTFAPPEGSSYVLRGVVTYEWRARGEVVRRARKRTERGHRSTAGSDPPGFSAGLCEIKP